MQMGNRGNQQAKNRARTDRPYRYNREGRDREAVSRGINEIEAEIVGLVRSIVSNTLRASALSGQRWHCHRRDVMKGVRSGNRRSGHRPRT